MNDRRACYVYQSSYRTREERSQEWIAQFEQQLSLLNTTTMLVARLTRRVKRRSLTIEHRDRPDRSFLRSFVFTSLHRAIILFHRRTFHFMAFDGTSKRNAIR